MKKRALIIAASIYFSIPAFAEDGWDASFPNAGESTKLEEVGGSAILGFATGGAAVGASLRFNPTNLDGPTFEAAFDAAARAELQKYHPEWLNSLVASDAANKEVDRLEKMQALIKTKLVNGEKISLKDFPSLPFQSRIALNSSDRDKVRAELRKLEEAYELAKRNALASLKGASQAKIFMSATVDSMKFNLRDKTFPADLFTEHELPIHKQVEFNRVAKRLGVGFGSLLIADTLARFLLKMNGHEPGPFAVLDLGALASPPESDSHQSPDPQ